MKHISYSTFLGMAENGQFIMPTTMHNTYCRKVVKASEIDNENPTCEECMDSKIWEDIDNLQENEHQEGIGVC